jgi:ribosome biogenesis GTPase
MSYKKIPRTGSKYGFSSLPEPGFVCAVCNTPVSLENAGTEHRNHCPQCLCSVHLDNKPGDRSSLCKGIMDAIGVWVKKNGEWAIIHRCRSCGKLSANRIAADDNPMLLMSISLKPLANPPFPLCDLPRGGDNAENTEEINGGIMK